MDIKTELENLKHISKIIDAKLKDLARLKESFYSLRSYDFTKERYKTSSVYGLENLVIKIIDFENTITKDIDHLVDKKKEMEGFVKENLSGAEYLVIHLRYFQCMSWEEIAEELNYGIRHIYKLHGGALEKLRKRWQ